MRKLRDDESAVQNGFAEQVAGSMSHVFVIHNEETCCRKEKPIQLIVLVLKPTVKSHEVIFVR